MHFPLFSDDGKKIPSVWKGDCKFEILGYFFPQHSKGVSYSIDC